MSSLYTDDVQKVIRQYRPPHQGFQCSVVETPTKLILVTYSDNMSMFPDSVQQDFRLWVMKIQTEITKLGIPCTIETKESMSSALQ